MAAVMEKAALQKLRVVDLKEKLTELGLPTGGGILDKTLKPNNTLNTVYNTHGTTILESSTVQRDVPYLEEEDGLVKPVDGLKADLVNRLHTYYVENAEKEAEESTPYEEPEPEQPQENLHHRVELQQQMLRDQNQIMGQLEEEAEKQQQFEVPDNNALALMQKVQQQQQMIRAEQEWMQIEQQQQKQQQLQEAELLHQQQIALIEQQKQQQLLQQQQAAAAVLLASAPALAMPPQLVSVPPPATTGPPPLMSLAPPPLVGPPQLTTAPTMVAAPQLLSGPPPQVSLQPPQQLSMPPQMVNQPTLTLPPPQLLQLGQPTSTSAPPQDTGPQPLMSMQLGPLQPQMGPPPQQLLGPPSLAPPQQLSGPPILSGGPPQLSGPPPPGPPQQLGPPMGPGPLMDIDDRLPPQFNDDRGPPPRFDDGRPPRFDDRDDRGPRFEDRDDRGPNRFDDRDDRGPPRFDDDRDDRGPRFNDDRDDRGPPRFDDDDRGRFDDRRRRFDDDRGPPRQDRDDRHDRHDRDDRGPPHFDDHGPPRHDDHGPPRFNDDHNDRGPPGPPPRFSGPPKIASLMDLDIPPPVGMQQRMDGPPVNDDEQQPVSIEQPPIKVREIRLPMALEKVLAFKDERAQQIGFDAEELKEKEPEGEDEEATPAEADAEAEPEQEYEFDKPKDDEGEDIEEEDDDEEEDEEPKILSKKEEKESKNKRRKKKKKKAAKNRFAVELEEQRLLKQDRRRRGRFGRPRRALPKVTPITEPAKENVIVDYIADQPEIEPADPHYYTFTRIFEVFKITEASKLKHKSEEKKEVTIARARKLGTPSITEASKLKHKPEEKKEPVKDKETGKTIETLKDEYDEDDADDEKVEVNPEKLSKKKMKKLSRLSVAELKQLVSRPDVVEMHDVTAQDPRLLVHLKSTRNTVPVPRHWCFKRKYLQGKRGIEKPPFELPEYIRDTGIMEMRQALQDKEEAQNLKSKMREKIRPKMGKIDIDYQKLHDAFFKWQIKPKMTMHGDLYYEGKEFETKLREKKPGNLTDDMRIALGMPVGPNADKVPPPWLIAMQRYGPPPSYPSMKIPGLNAPIPEACSFGYHAGGWGKPPVDNTGKPLYGDVFGSKTTETKDEVMDEVADVTQWGEMESESESEEESEEEEAAEEPEASGLVTPGPEGLVTPSGLVSAVPQGMETPDMIELRKKRIEDAMDQGAEMPALYQVIPEKRATVGTAMMGSAHVYDLAAAKKGEKLTAEGVEVALNPDELDLDTAAMQAKYDETLREQQSQIEKDDLTDMVAEHAAKQKKRKSKTQDSSKSSKKYKEFKF